MPDNIMGENLRFILKQRGLSVQAVSIKSGISHATITRMIRGDGSARVQAWMAVCEALGVGMDELMKEKEM